MTTYTFPLDRKQFRSKALMYEYIETKYPQLLSEGMPASRLYFNLKYKKTEGKCVITGKPTRWNPVTERYERFFDENAKTEYVKQFQERMKRKYGAVHLLDSPEQQRKMLESRKITVGYTWNNGDVSKATGNYELDFLRYIESRYCFTKDMLGEPPTIYYKDGNKTAFYLPDFYIPSLNLIIEIKGSNRHYQDRDSYKESLKHKATIKEGFAFIQIQDNHYSEFNRFFKEQVLDK